MMYYMNSIPFLEYFLIHGYNIFILDNKLKFKSLEITIIIGKGNRNAYEDLHNVIKNVLTATFESTIKNLNEWTNNL